MAESILPQKLSEEYHKDAAKQRGYYSVRQWSQDKFGIQDQSMSNYMLGKRNPSGENLELLIDVYGKDVYTWMGREVPDDYDPVKRAVYRRWKKLSPEARQKITEIVEQELAKKPKTAGA